MVSLPALALLAASVSGAAEAWDVALVQTCDAARLSLRVGVLPRGTKLSIHLQDGTAVGAVAPFGLLKGQPAGIQEFALPPRRGHVTLRLSLQAYGMTDRAPSGREVSGVKIVCPK
jgi:hypothetical protein